MILTRIIPIIFFFILSLFLFWEIYYMKEDEQLSSALIDKKFPILDLDKLQGEYGFNDLIGSKPFIVNYFASWCAPCRVEHKVLKKLSSRFIIIGIGYKDSEENIKKFLSELGNPYKTIFMDKNGRAAIDLGLYGVPETYFINKDGKLKHRHVGPLTLKKFENIVYLLDN